MRFRCLITVLFAFCAVAHAAPILPPPGATVPLITTTTDPSDYVVGSPSPFDAIAKLIFTRTTQTGTFGCSGSLVGGGSFVLTAAHCIASGQATPNIQSLTATFPGTGSQTFSGLQYYVAPGWTGDGLGGADLALVRLASTVPLTSYGLLRSDPTPGSRVTLAGYGQTGIGATGGGGFGTLRAGANTIDARWSIPGLPFAYDFDNGQAAQDALNLLVGIEHLGLGDDEVMIAPGDSGGPLFYDWQIAGVHSFGARFETIDLDGVLNASFGELGGSTRVSAYSDWLDSYLIPEPGTFTMAGAALLALGLAFRRRV